MSSHDLAPVALFVYSRPTLTRQTIDALARNNWATGTNLVIYSDGPKGTGDQSAVAEVRRLIADVSGFKSVKVIISPTNKGLARSIVDGVTATISEHGRLIVVEDDMITSPYFLQFMNDALNCYQHDEKVSSVSGYMFPHDTELPETFFMHGISSWGWATWSRSWALFEPDGRKLLSELAKRRLQTKFDDDGAYPYTRMLEDRIAGRNQSWAILWRASMFLNGMLSLFPCDSLVCNTGTDGSGTHNDKTGTLWGSSVRQHAIRVDAIPIQPNRAASKTVRRFLGKHYGRTGLRGILRGLRARLVRIASIGRAG